MINLQYRTKRGPDLDLLSIQQEYQNNAQHSISADKLMKSHDPALHVQAWKLATMALHKTEVMHLFLSTAQIEEVAQILSPEKVLEAYRQQVKDIEKRLRNEQPECFTTNHLDI